MRTFAWRSWNHGPLVSRHFDTPVEAGQWRRDRGGANRQVTLLAFEDGEPCRLEPHEFTEALMEYAGALA